MDQKKYDVFVSYSRKDYVKDDEIIPDNPISEILAMFDKNNISYWFDKEGIYSGQEFVEIISNAIVNSKMLIFISSTHSNNSIYTAGEIFEALDGEKLIIPVRIDDCPYNKKFKMLVRPLDYVDYQAQPKTALTQLLRAVNIEKERIAKIEEEERQRLLEKQKEAHKEKVKQEITEKAKEYHALVGQQDYILKELYSKNKFIGNTIKSCPVCEKKVPLQSLFCEQCGWQFPRLYGIDGREAPLFDETQFTIACTHWKNLGGLVQLQKEKKILEDNNHEIENECKKLKESLSIIKEGNQKQQDIIAKKNSEMATLQKEVLSLSSQLETTKRDNVQKEKDLARIAVLENQIATLHTEIKLKEESKNKCQTELNSATAKNTSLTAEVTSLTEKNKTLLSQNVYLQKKYEEIKDKVTKIEKYSFEKNKELEEAIKRLKDIEYQQSKSKTNQQATTIEPPKKYNNPLDSKIVIFSQNAYFGYRYGYINKETGHPICPAKWKNAYSFYEGLACVQCDSGEWGYINTDGNLSIPCKWKKASSFSEGLAAVMDHGGKWGYINNQGNLVIGCKYYDAGSFKNGYATVRNASGNHRINRAGIAL